MTRRCSHCSNNGHNSRTCPNRSGGAGGGGGSGGGVRLFGVRLTDGSIMKKSASMGNLSSLHHHASATSPAPGSPASDVVNVPDGYLSDDPTHASSSANRQVERKKGVPWSEEEHRLFLIGLSKLGKGDWRGISRNYVTSRTPTQVASHAQKHFIRQSHANRRKRRSSLFDMPGELPPPPPPEEPFVLPYQVIGGYDVEQTVHSSSQAKRISLDLSLKPDFESMDITPVEAAEETRFVAPAPEVPAVCPSTHMSLQLQLCPPNVPVVDEGAEISQHQTLRPIPVVPNEPVNVDEIVGMSQLNLGETATHHREPSPLSLRLTGEGSRQSAFQASTSVNSL